MVLGVFKCAQMVSKRIILASSTALLAMYANCRGSIRGSKDLVVESLIILSIAFITKEFNGTGLKSFNVLVGPFLGMEIPSRAIWGSLKKLLEILPQLLSTVLQDPPTDVSPEVSEHLFPAESGGLISRLKCGDDCLVDHPQKQATGAICLHVRTILLSLSGILVNRTQIALSLEIRWWN